MLWRERLPLIWAIVRKDLSRARTSIIVSAIIVSVIGFLLGSTAYSMSRFGFFRFAWSDVLVRLFYAVAATITALTLGLVFYTVHGGEVHKGTIRSIILYPVDANDIAIAKLASSFLLSLSLSSILFLGPLSPFFLFGVWPFPDFLGLLLIALGTSFVSLATGVFLAHVVAHFSRRMILSPTAWGSLFMLVSLFLTETSITVIGNQVLYIFAQSRPNPFPTPGEFQAVADLARTLSVLSPHHWGARLLSIGFGVFPAGGEIPMAISAALTALALVGGYVYGRKLYLDLFVH